MRAGVLQMIEAGALVVIAVAAHWVTARARRPFVEALGGLGGASVRGLVAVGDVIAWLLYLAYGAAFVPFEDVGLMAPGRVEDGFDGIAVFALLVAAVQVATLVVAHRIAHNLEPWPPAAEAAS